MKQTRDHTKDQSQILIRIGTAMAFLFVVFRLNMMENIGHSPYLPYVAIGLMILQLFNHEQASISLRKKSPNFTNDFYSENGRMLFGNMIASALVLEFNVYNYEQFIPNIIFEVISIPLVLFLIFIMENARGGLFSLERIYFPKKWDQAFKNYGVNMISACGIVLLWLPVLLKIPISAPLWILLSTLMIRESVVYTNKYNYLGWCFVLEGLFVLQILTLGIQGDNWFMIGVGVLAGMVYLAVYMKRSGTEKGLTVVACLLFAGGIIGFQLQNKVLLSVVNYLQLEIAFFIVIFAYIKFCSIIYRKWFKKEEISKYSYEGAEVQKQEPIRKNEAKSALPDKRKTKFLLKTGKNSIPSAKQEESKKQNTKLQEKSQVIKQQAVKSKTEKSKEPNNRAEKTKREKPRAIESKQEKANEPKLQQGKSQSLKPQEIKRKEIKAKDSKQKEAVKPAPKQNTKQTSKQMPKQIGKGLPKSKPQPKRKQLPKQEAKKKQSGNQKPNPIPITAVKTATKPKKVQNSKTNAMPKATGKAAGKGKGLPKAVNTNKTTGNRPKKKNYFRKKTTK